MKYLEYTGVCILFTVFISVKLLKDEISNVNCV